MLLEKGRPLPSSWAPGSGCPAGSYRDRRALPSQELIGGYAIVGGLAQKAIELGKQFMELHARVLGPSYDGECEVSQRSMDGLRSSEVTNAPSRQCNCGAAVIAGIWPR